MGVVFSCGKHVLFLSNQSNILEERRKQRAVRWTDFREKLAQERDQVDIEHVQRKKAVEDHFEKHTEKLATIGDTR